MKVKIFRELLAEHRAQLADPATLTSSNRTELNTRQGRLRVYISRYDASFSDSFSSALDSSYFSVRQAAIARCIDKIDTLIGRVMDYHDDAEIPEDKRQPILCAPQSPLPVETLIRDYLQHLHPSLTRCADLLRDGHFEPAVAEAAKAVFQYLRDVTGRTDDGAPLAQNVFGEKRVLRFSHLQSSSEVNEQVGFMEILVGFAKGIRNVSAHVHGTGGDARSAFEHLILASFLCRRIDDAKSFTDANPP